MYECEYCSVASATHSIVVHHEQNCSKKPKPSERTQHEVGPSHYEVKTKLTCFKCDEKFEVEGDMGCGGPSLCWETKYTCPLCKDT